MWQNVNIDTNQLIEKVSVQRSILSDYHHRITHGLPLPDLNYSLSIDRHPSPIFQTTELILRGKVIQTYSGSFMLADNDVLMQYGSAFCTAKRTELINGRRNRLLAKLKGQSLPLIMLYKERHQTGNLVLKFLDDAIFCARNIRNPRRVLKRYGWTKAIPGPYNTISKLKRHTIRNCKTIGDAFLQYRFAWLPLYKDIEDSLKAASESEKKGIQGHVAAGLPFEYTYNRTKHDQDGAVGYHTGTYTEQGRYHIKCRYLITDTTLAMAAQIQNVEFTLWDSIPYSFLVDRLVNIGKYLDLRYATAGVAFSSGHETTFYRYNCSMPESEIYDSYGRTVTSSSTLYWLAHYHGPDRTGVRLTRSVLSSFPTPTLEYPYKDFFSGFSRKLEVTALLLQRLLRMKT